MNLLFEGSGSGRYYTTAGRDWDFFAFFALAGATSASAGFLGKGATGSACPAPRNRACLRRSTFGRRLLVAIVVIGVAGAAPNLGGLAPSGNDGVVRSACT